MKKSILLLLALVCIGMVYGLSYDFGNGGRFDYTDVSDLDIHEQDSLILEVKSK